MIIHSPKYRIITNIETTGLVWIYIIFIFGTHMRRLMAVHTNDTKGDGICIYIYIHTLSTHQKCLRSWYAGTESRWPPILQLKKRLGRWVFFSKRYLLFRFLSLPFTCLLIRLLSSMEFLRGSVLNFKGVKACKITIYIHFRLLKIILNPHFCQLNHYFLLLASSFEVLDELKQKKHKQGLSPIGEIFSFPILPYVSLGFSLVFPGFFPGFNPWSPRKLLEEGDSMTSSAAAAAARATAAWRLFQGEARSEDRYGAFGLGHQKPMALWINSWLIMVNNG